MKTKLDRTRSKPPARGRFSKEIWLKEALDVLSHEGEGKLRIDYVSSLFRELGFRGIELETRTTAFLKAENRVTGKRIEDRTAHRIETELKFFTSAL